MYSKGLEVPETVKADAYVSYMTHNQMAMRNEPRPLFSDVLNACLKMLTSLITSKYIYTCIVNSTVRFPYP